MYNIYIYTYIYTVYIYIYIRILSTINPESLSLVYTYIYVTKNVSHIGLNPQITTLVFSLRFAFDAVCMLFLCAMSQLQSWFKARCV